MKKSLVRFVLASTFLSSVTIFAPQPLSPVLHAETYTSASQAGPIFQLQGEYLGVIDAWGGTWGAQVVATSETSVSVHLLDGGLPGQGFDKRDPTKVFDAKFDKGTDRVELKKEDAVLMLKPDSLTVLDSKGKKLGVLTKVLRESKTLGARPEAGGKVLFEVGGPNDFEGGKLAEDGLLGVGGTTKEAFDDHHLHVEFRTPFQPSDSGQGRGNSGVYIQGRYELQVLDSFGLSGEDNECGGIYQVSKPKLNMCYPPLSWQTYDIDFTAAKYDAEGKKTKNARVTIKHNGVTIHEDLELPRQTPGKDQEANKPGPLFLQDHGNPVAYRNVWVVANRGK